MNAVIPIERISEALLSITTAPALEHSAEAAGWKSEAQRLAQGAKRQTREPRQ